MHKILLAAAFAAMATSSVMADNNETMYLIKGEQVIGKYNVDDVDYISFNLPDDVSDKNIILKVNETSKNSVSYTVGTTSSSVAYAHGIMTAAYLDVMAISYEGDYFANLDEEMQVMLMQELLTYDGYVAQGTRNFTMTDWELTGDQYGSRFSVLSGTEYYVCAWELDAATFEPLETFVYAKFTTKPGETTSAQFNCEFVEQNEYGLQFSFTGDSNVAYVRTVYGEKEVMGTYVNAFGLDFTMAAFGQNWELDYLQGTGEVADGVSNSIWSAYDAGEYVMYARAYDYNGDYKDVMVEATYGEPEVEGPQITIYSKEKNTGYVKVNFEISPSNVEEAYVRLCGENFVDDRLNMGYTLQELAMGGDATDITNEINTNGEYTYINNEVEDQWCSLLIFAKDKDGYKTTQRINFFPDSDSHWSIESPVYTTSVKKASRRSLNRNNPTIKK